MSRTNLHGPKDVRVIKVRLFFFFYKIARAQISLRIHKFWFVFITKTRLFKYIENFTTKNWKKIR